MANRGVQYHIGLAPGELAETVLLCGDPARAGRVSGLFDELHLSRAHREFLTHTGSWKGVPISVMSTGIGADNTEIAVIEASRITSSPTFIRVGSCGTLKRTIGIGDLIISSGAVRLENTSTFFVHEGYPASAHFEVLMALMGAAESGGTRYHVGLTATAPGFYGAQCRQVEGFPLRDPGLMDGLARQGVLNYEMETSALFTLASLGGFRAGAVCAVYAQRPTGKFISDRQIPAAEKKCIDVGMEAARLLHRMDEVKKRRRKRFWTAELSLSSPP
jgi:uridine phosphorylase